jgi:hypothetical protein
MNIEREDAVSDTTMLMGVATVCSIKEKENESR